MKTIYICIIFILFSCCDRQETASNSKAPTTSSTISSSRPPRNYVDEGKLGMPPQKNLDAITIQKIEELQASRQRNFKLAIGCPNDKSHRERFAQDENWVFLDRTGYARGNAFLHMDFGNVDTLKLIAEDGQYSLKGFFKEIIFDFSVARFSQEFSAENISLLLNLLNNNGTIYMWPDELPFLKDSNISSTPTKAQWIDELQEKIKLLKMRNKALRKDKKDAINLNILDMMFSEWFNIPYRTNINGSGMADPHINSLLDTYETEYLEGLKIAFEFIGANLEVKHGTYPLPGEDRVFYKNATYYAITRRGHR
jgi:hypothetical protein